MPKLNLINELFDRFGSERFLEELDYLLMRIMEGEVADDFELF